MFWESVFSGFTSLLDWHILVGLVGVSAIMALHPLSSVMLLRSSSDSEISKYMGFVVFLFGGVFLQVVSVSLFVMLCLPSIIGQGGFIPSELIGPLFFKVLYFGMIAYIMVFLLSLMPVIGHFISYTPGAIIFLQGIFMLKPLTRYLMGDASFHTVKLPVTVFPTMWNSIGFVVIGVVMVMIMFSVMENFFTNRKRKEIGEGEPYLEEEDTIFKMVSFIVLGPICGILPLLMYGKFVGYSIRLYLESL